MSDPGTGTEHMRATVATRIGILEQSSDASFLEMRMRATVAMRIGLLEQSSDASFLKMRVSVLLGNTDVTRPRKGIMCY